MSVLSDKTNYKLIKYASETMVYFERHKLLEISKRILVECAIERPEDVQLWIAKNIKRIANLIYSDCLNKGRNGVIEKLHMSGQFNYRVVFFGRRGSGRKTQAWYLAARFKLIYLDAEILIHEHLRGDDDNPNDPLDRELQRAFYYDHCEAKGKAIAAILARRVLQEDCLTRGWVLVNYPHTLEEFKELVENTSIPPNRIVFLHCSREVCMKRLVGGPDMEQPFCTVNYFDAEMDFYDDQEENINAYLHSRNETLWVNGECRTQDVRTEVLSLVMKSPGIISAKHDEIPNAKSHKHRS